MNQQMVGILFFITGMGDLDHAGFLLDKHQFKFEILDSKIAKGIMKIIVPAGFQEINF